MNRQLEKTCEIEIGRNWPEQTVVDHAPYWRAWRKQARQCRPMVEMVYGLIGSAWILFANGKNLGPQLMLDWMQHVVNIPSKKSGTGVISGPYAIRYRSVTASYLSWLRLMGAIQVDPSPCMPKIRSTPPQPKQTFTHEEYIRMFAYAEERGSCATHQWLLVLGYHTGMSLVDCCGLRWSQVQLPDDGPCCIRKMRAKLISRFGTRSTFTVPIVVGSELWVWFKKMQARHKNDIDNTGANDFVNPEAGDWLSIRYEEPTQQMTWFIRKAIGGEKARNMRSFRNLRNTFASRLINAGVDAVLVSKMTGHQTLSQLAEYLVPEHGSMQEAVLKGLRHVEGATVLPARKDIACS